jgi:hypothetical protein
VVARDDEDEAGEDAIQGCFARCKAGGERHPQQCADETAGQIFCGHRNGCALMIAAVNFTGTTDTRAVRAAMAGAPSGFVLSSDLEGILKAWRRVQVRQLFRLSLEAFFYWIFLEIGEGTRSTETLANAFLAQATLRPADGTTAEWLEPTDVITAAPTALMDRIEDAARRGPICRSGVDDCGWSRLLLGTASASRK